MAVDREIVAPGTQAELARLQEEVTSLNSRRCELKARLRTALDENRNLRWECEYWRLIAVYRSYLLQQQTKWVRDGEKGADGNGFSAEDIIRDSWRSVFSEKLLLTPKFISFSHRFIYVSVPKVASQSMLRQLALCGADGEYCVTNAPLSLAYQAVPDLRTYHKFSVVRHPFSRAVSFYIDKVLNINDSKKRLLDKYDAGWIRSFDDFVQFLSSRAGGDSRADPHWGSQFGILSGGTEELEIDAYLTLENLETELPRFFRSVGMQEPKTLVRKNIRERHVEMATGQSERVSDESFWSSEAEAMIFARYQKDYEVFGYSELRGTGE